MIVLFKYWRFRNFPKNFPSWQLWLQENIGFLIFFIAVRSALLTAKTWAKSIENKNSLSIKTGFTGCKNLNFMWILSSKFRSFYTSNTSIIEKIGFRSVPLFSHFGKNKTKIPISCHQGNITNNSGVMSLFKLVRY